MFKRIDNPHLNPLDPDIHKALSTEVTMKPLILRNVKLVTESGIVKAGGFLGGLEPQARATSTAYSMVKHESGLQVPKAIDGAETQHAFKQADGSYHPARAALHEHIINHFLNHGNTEAHPYEEDRLKGRPQAVFLAGGAGSGKSYYKNQKYGHHPQFVHVDPDAIKEMLPEFHPKSPSLTHEESTDIGRELHRRVLDQGRSFIYDGTGSNVEGMIAKIHKTRNTPHGYRIHARRVKVPLDQAQEQNQKRPRSVSPEVLHTSHQKVDEAWPVWSPLADTQKTIHNRRYAGPSPLTARREARQRHLAQNGKLNMQAARNGPRKGMAMNDNDEDGISKAHTAHAAHHGSAHKSHRAHAPHKKIQRARVHMKPHHYMDGHIKDGHFHVSDDVYDGTSYRDMTGEKPSFKPIPVSKIHGRGHRIEYLN